MGSGINTEVTEGRGWASAGQEKDKTGWPRVLPEPGSAGEWPAFPA